MKKKYISPATDSITVTHMQVLMSSVTNTGGNSGIGYGGGGSGPARSRQTNLWNDSDEEEQ